MNNATIDKTLKFTKDLKVLYVEDDLEIRTQTKEFFEVLFHSVVVVNNGKDALKIYNDEHFDIIISDVKMPIMDGIELTKQIKQINPSQCIIITSAYNDSEDLLKFINLNIKQFIQKPIDIDKMLETLYEVSRNIVNSNMVESYRKELEINNKELSKKNSELKSLVRILDEKLIQIAQHNKDNDTDIDLKKAIIKYEHLNELKELEIDISGTAVLISLSNNLNGSTVKVLADMFLSYSKIVSNYEEYNSLSKNIKKLANILKEKPDNFIKKVDELSTLVESFIYVLRMWRKNLVEHNIKRAFDLHSSMINDIQTVIQILDINKGDLE
jgi:CheY-like chemotaxis protein